MRYQNIRKELNTKIIEGVGLIRFMLLIFAAIFTSISLTAQSSYTINTGGSSDILVLMF